MLHGSMLDLDLGGRASVCHRYICILLYVKLIGIYMCILLYVKLIGCNGVV